VEIEPVDGRFTGGSSVGPLDPPAVLPGVPEYWSGASEAATNPPDDPAAAAVLTLAAGQTLGGIDVVMNALPPPPNDACDAATPIALPFVGVLDTRGATTGVGDPLQSCTFGGPNQNSSSVWYAFTASASGTVIADTLGSDYDTVLTAYVGSCGALTELACNDDALGGLDSRIAFAVQAGETILLEVAGWDLTGGGQLQLSVRPGVGCDATPRTGCRAASSARLRLVREPVNGSLDRLLWRWVGAGGTSFGDPTTFTDYALCLYDETGDTPALRMTSTIAAGGSCGSRPCWSGSVTSFRYNDPDPNGIERLILRQGTTARATIMLRGRGAALGLPALPLAQDQRVTVQLVNGDGGCWDARYPAPATRNDGVLFTDRTS
jgi:hypothetical protein